MTPETEHTAKLFLSRLSNRYEMREAYLFGSRAKELAGPESDADIAILLQGHSGHRTIARKHG